LQFSLPPRKIEEGWENMMRSTSKAFIVTFVAWLVFTIIISFDVIRYSINYYLPLSFLFLLSLLAIVYVFTSKRNNEKPKLEEKQPFKASDYLTQVAKYDNLTSLPNQIVFNEMLNKSLNQAKRQKKILAILLVNIDSLKIINDKLGTKNSDALIKEMGKRFEGVLRSEDVLAKLDNNQFIILLNDILKPKFASSVAEKILHACSQPLLIGSKQLPIKASIGICIYPNDGQSLEELLKNADLALYKAKHSGSHVYQFYTHEMDIEGHEYIQLEHSLRKAIKNNEFKLYYQPKLYIKKGSVISVEALLRWEHPELGLINPNQFIPLAEETGMIMQLGEWALREACRTNKYWQDEGYEHISVSLNLSPKQFHHPTIAQSIATILAETGLNPHYLELEITEKDAMDNTDAAIIILNKIKETGVKIVIDHFGTGHTSISHLKQFPISALKIDQSFIKGIPNNPNDSAITNAMIALAHNLGLEIVAEGVETAEQVEYLANHSCDTIQGYYISHPLPAESVVNQFKKLRDGVLI
jgi:diguanylate cyclase (GGDEF)-like protein